MFKIISIGQTSVEKAALDAALNSELECERYNDHSHITNNEDGKLQTVNDSDGTLIIYFGSLTSNTEKTLTACIHEKKPYKLIDAQLVGKKIVAAVIFSFIKSKNISILNVTGEPIDSSSGARNAYTYTFDALNQYLTFITQNS